MSWKLQHRLKRRQKLSEKEERRRQRLEKFSNHTDVEDILNAAKKGEEEEEEESSSDKKVSWGKDNSQSSSSSNNHHNDRNFISHNSPPSSTWQASNSSPRISTTPSKKRPRVWESPSSLTKHKKIDPKWLDDSTSASPTAKACKSFSSGGSSSFRKQRLSLSSYSDDNEREEWETRKQPATAVLPQKQSSRGAAAAAALADDSDDDSFGDAIIFRELGEKFAKKNKSQSQSSTGDNNDDDDDDDNNASGKNKSPMSSQSSTTRIKHTPTLEDTVNEFTPTQEDSIQDDDDDENGNSSKAASKSSVARRPRVATSQEAVGWSSDEEELQAVAEKLGSPAGRKEEGTRIPHNPIALERAARAQVLMVPAQVASRGDGNDLWSDSEPGEDELQEEETPSPKRKGKRKSKESGGKPSRSDPKPKKPSSGSASRVFWEDSTFDLPHGRQNQLLGEEELEKQLHPILDKPKFGPFELKPLVMEQQDDKGNQHRHQVPAALNRYLAPFQQDGVKFMHKCMVNNMGCVLGDDMGCGKTVQAMSLLSALFEKTGTGLDARKIEKRQDKIKTLLQQRKCEEDEALMQGRLFDIPKSKALNTKEIQELELSERWWPVLIVVPSTVLDNWKREIAEFTHFSVACYCSGSNRENALKQVACGMAEIMLTAHSMLQQAADFREINGAQVKWKLVIIDEFHKFKSESSKWAQNLRAIKSLHRNLVLGMTGTLMQNNHAELWNLIDLVETDYLGDYNTFKSYYELPIKHGRSKTASAALVAESKRKAFELQQKLGTLLIERKKEHVLKDFLPDKNEKAVMCELSPLQKQVYQHLLTLPDFDLVRKANSPCDCGVNSGFFQRVHRLKTRAERVAFYRQNKDSIVVRRECCYMYPQNPRYVEGGDEPLIDPDAAIWRMINGHGNGEPCSKCPFCCGFPTLTKLYKLGDHLALLQAFKRPGSGDVGSPQNVDFVKDLEFAKVALPHVVDHLPGESFIRQDGIMDDHFALSGKLKVLDKLLQNFSKEDSKVLLFSFSTQTLDLVQNYLRASGHSYLRMDGTTAPSIRQETADAFNSDPTKFIFLLSTRAMGTGLNLTSANKVIIFDVEWNPSNDEQAQDRAYRIGQERDVEVFRLVAQGTIDELKYLRQLYKVHLKQETLVHNDESSKQAARLFRGVQGDSARKGELFGYENLFRFKDGSFLSDIWKKTGRKMEDKHRKGDLVVHEASKLTDALLGLGSSKALEDVLQDESNSIENNIVGNATGEIEDVEPTANDSNGSAREDVGSGNEADAPAFVHGDLFHEDRGRAAVEEGDDGFDEEMGGGTQNIVALIEHDAAVADTGNESGEEGTENGNEAGGDSLDAQAFDHGDLFRDDRGRAAIEEGEDGFDEEMGGGTQNMVAIYEGGVAMPDNPQDGRMDYGEESADNDAESATGGALEEEPIRHNDLPGRFFDAPPPPIRGPRPSINAAIVHAVQPPRLEEPVWVADSESEPDTNYVDGTRSIEQEDDPDDAADASNGGAVGERLSPRIKQEEDNAKRETTSRAAKAIETNRVRSVSRSPAAGPNVNLFGSPSVQLKDKSTTFSANDLFLPTYKKKKKKRKKSDT